MQVTIYIPKDDELQWEFMKKSARDKNEGIGAYIINLDTERILRDEESKAGKKS